MTNHKKKIQSIAESLGYDPKAIHRDSLAEAKGFVTKIAKRHGDIAVHEIEYAMQVVINTLTWEVAQKVVKEDDNVTG